MKIALSVAILDDMPDAALQRFWEALSRLAEDDTQLPTDPPWVVRAHGLEIDVACTSIPTPEEAITFLANSDRTCEYDLVLLDNDWPRGGSTFGLVLLEAHYRVPPRPPLLAIYTASEKYAPAAMIARAFRAGAKAVVKKEEPNHLLNLLFVAAEMAALRNENIAFKTENNAFKSAARQGLEAVEPKLVSASPVMQKCVAEAGKYASQANTPILIYGATGTGKAIIAGALHRASPRAAKPFVHVDCARYKGIDKQVFNDLLFGHVKGAYTDAATARAGVFEQANGGTLFFDEFQDLPEEQQGSLKTVLDKKVIRREGGNEDIPCDFRIICASNVPYKDLVDGKKLLRDLYRRINVGNVTLPTLAERAEDIPKHANDFLKEFAGRERRAIAGITPGAMAKLVAQPWEGNIGELENTIWRSVMLLAEGRTQLDVADLKLDGGETEPIPEAPPVGILAKLRPRNDSKQQKAYDLLTEKSPGWVSYEELYRATGEPVENPDRASGNLAVLMNRLNERFAGHQLKVANDRKGHAYRLIRTHKAA